MVYNKILIILLAYLRAVLLEDSAACLGVLAAVGGVGMSHLTQNPIWDPIAR